MNLDALILTIKSNAGIDSTDTQYDTRLTSAINQEKDRLSQGPVLPLLEAQTTLSTTASVEQDELPTGIYPWRIYGIYQGLYPPLERMTEREFLSEYPGSTFSGTPVAYRCFASNSANGKFYIKWFPKPSGVLTYTIDYWAYLADLSAGSDQNVLTDLYPYVLVHKAHLSLLNDFLDAGNAALISTDYKLAYDAMISDIKRLTNLKIVIGGKGAGPKGSRRYPGGFFPSVITE